MAVVLLAACGVAKIALGQIAWTASLLGGLLVGGLLLAAALAGKDALGGGNIKLGSALGGLYGFTGGAVILGLAMLALAVYGLARGRERLAFAPFVLGSTVAFNILSLII